MDLKLDQYYEDYNQCITKLCIKFHNELWVNKNKHYNDPSKVRIRLIEMHNKTYYNVLNCRLILLKKYVR